MLFVFTTSGERGIRTPGPVTVNSFQDCRIRPLCHFSNKSCNHFRIASANIERFFIFANLLRIKNTKKYTFFLTLSLRNNYRIKKSRIIKFGFFNYEMIGIIQGILQSHLSELCYPNHLHPSSLNEYSHVKLF